MKTYNKFYRTSNFCLTVKNLLHRKFTWCEFQIYYNVSFYYKTMHIQLGVIRAVAGQRSSPDLCFATKSIKIYDP